MGTETLTDTDWHVRTANYDGDTVKIRAAYHRFVEGQPFIEFKDANHKLVYTVAAHQVVDIARVPTEPRS